MNILVYASLLTLILSEYYSQRPLRLCLDAGRHPAAPQTI